MIRLLPEIVMGEWPDRCPYAFGHESGTLAVVVGRAPCRDDDLEALGKPHADFLAINESGIVLPKVKHWGSIHGDKLKRWLDERMASGRAEPEIVVGNFINAPNDARISRWKASPYPGSSALFMVRWALFWGYRRVVLCGVPLEGHQGVMPDGSMSNDPGGYHVYRKGWVAQEKHLPLAECVRSMSGWTRDRYGAPDAEFLG
jgi:hypothetical protein